MVTLSQNEAIVLTAFLESFDLRLTGAWVQVEKGMREDFGIEDPEGELDRARQALQG